MGRHGKDAGQGMSLFKFQRDILSAEEKLGHSKAEEGAGRAFGCFSQGIVAWTMVICKERKADGGRYVSEAE